jgi:hypothetical protein
MGTLQFYDVVCELFEYSNEVFNTGLDIIDDMYNALLTTTDPYVITMESGIYLTDEAGFDLLEEDYDINILDEGSQNSYFENEGIDLLDFSERDPFSELEKRA